VQVQDLLATSVDASVAVSLSRDQYHLPAHDLTPEVVPIIPDPEEDEDVDTTLRLSLTQPNANGRQAE
jgi:hypothetical protein